MNQDLYAHMNNKRKMKRKKKHLSPQGAYNLVGIVSIINQLNIKCVKGV
jgi:hypothetical protein